MVRPATAWFVPPPIRFVSARSGGARLGVLKEGATGLPSGGYLRGMCACSTPRPTMPAQPPPGGIRYPLQARAVHSLVCFQGHITVCRAPVWSKHEAGEWRHSDVVASESNAVMGTSGGPVASILGEAARACGRRCGARQGRRPLPAHRALPLSTWRFADRYVIAGAVH